MHYNSWANRINSLKAELVYVNKPLSCNATQWNKEDSLEIGSSSGNIESN